jgi:phenylpropionate dioxygenase-like ring-hydroxylating dioxygenase large terminal subunit
VFLRNAWYVAAKSSDVDRHLTPLTILGESIVVFRRENGEAAALENACPHRKLPLSMGRRQGDSIVCGYHGLTFDAGGKCIAAPTQDKIPPNARVHSYPAVDRFGLLWIWMGEPALADVRKIVDIEHYQHPGWGSANGGPMTCGCNYLYLTDNLLDPSHVAWVHLTSFAASGTESTPLQIDVKSDGVVVWRWILDCEVPPFYAPVVKFAGRCDRLQHYEVRYPSVAINKSAFAPSGTGGAGKPLLPEAFVAVSYHFLTPLDESSTAYHWLLQRNSEADNAEISERMSAAARAAFEEDRVVLEAVHRGMASKTKPNINLALDAGPLRFRRELQALIDSEQAAAVAAPALSRTPMPS